MRRGRWSTPYFVLYNKYRGILRIYLYLTTEFVATSSYLQDGISVVSDHQTSLLSFLGKEIIDPEERYATTDYIQIQGSPDNISPMAANKWYMMQYELAYDPDITSIPYDQVQLAWYLNYCNVQTIKLGGTQEGRINGTIGAASSTTFYDEFKTAAKSTGTAVLTGIGKNFITENARDETTDSLGRNNNLGLPNYIYSSISNTINSALSGSLDEIPQALFKGFNAIFGLNKTTQPIPINLTFKSQIELNGDLSDRGSFPSSPSSFWLPGTDIASDAVGYIPLYNKPLGVLGLDGRPKVSPMVIYQRVSDGYKLFVTYKTNTFRQRLQYNPEVEAIADIQLTKLELIETDFQGRFTQVCPNRFFAGTLDTNYNPTSSIDVPEYLAFRATFKITPNNGDEPTVIIKTFKTDQDPLPLKMHNNSIIMKTLATFVLCLSLLAGFTACDKNDDNMGTLIVEIRDNAKASVLNIYTEEGSLIYTNTEYLYQNDPRLSIPLNPGNYRLNTTWKFNDCAFQIRAGHTTTVYYAYGSYNGVVTYD